MAAVDRRVRLVEETALPDSTRGAALLWVMPNIQGVFDFDDDEMRLAHRLTSRGYEWARASQFTLGIPLSDDTKQVLETMLEGREGTNESEFAWATLTSLMLKEHGPFIFSEGDDETPFQDVIDRELTAVGAMPEQPNASGMVDAFTLGAALCAAEKQVILALDWRDTKRAVDADTRRLFKRRGKRRRPAD